MLGIKYIVNGIGGLGRLVGRLIWADGSEIRVPGNHKINGAIAVGTETWERDALIIGRIGKIYRKDGKITGILADYYLGAQEHYYAESLYTERNLKIEALKNYDVFAYGPNAKSIKNTLSEYVN